MRKQIAKELAAKEEALRQERRVNIEQRLPLDRSSVNGYIYAKAAPSNHPCLSTKIGRASDKVSRICSQNYLIILPVEDAMMAENLIHRFLDSYKLRITPKREWFLITNHFAVEVVKSVANIINNTFKALDNSRAAYINEYTNNIRYNLKFDESIDVGDDAT